ncbi:hypothetical protein EZS27_033210 [termite gut metagenome]|uniref:Uncharacterized protein n=1 Tax=termite gut metagenome TaxID=433724 RepID=A0A5J4Q4B9_9ZZZZ
MKTIKKNFNMKNLLIAVVVISALLIWDSFINFAAQSYELPKVSKCQ